MALSSDAKGISNGKFGSHLSVAASNTNCGFVPVYCAPPIVIPAPSAIPELAAESANTRFLSFKDTTELLTIVSVPCTIRLPRITKSPESPTGNGSMNNRFELSVDEIVLPSILTLSNSFIVT